ncbi:hypothetical protein HAX54_005357, partial [Datura stramonium]|nr:hypothetical protein [Datura stramonium]
SAHWCGPELKKEDSSYLDLHKMYMTIDSEFGYKRWASTIESICLDLILHAEHQVILEEMRVEYDALIPTVVIILRFHLAKKEISRQMEGIPTLSRVMLSRLKIWINMDRHGTEESMDPQLLSNAGFEELSARDLRLTSALNTDYLLTLPQYLLTGRVHLSPVPYYSDKYDINGSSSEIAEQVHYVPTDQMYAVSDATMGVYARMAQERGYATERQKGLLIVEKLDYLQSKFLQGVLFLIVKPLKKVGIWLTEVLERSITKDNAQIWAKKIKLWLKHSPIFQQTSSDNQHMSNKPFEVDALSENDLPLLKAAMQ